jgi:hypothetical protein
LDAAGTTVYPVIEARATREERDMESRGSGAAGEAITGLSGLWWLWLVTGIAWIVVSVVILQFDQASVTTVGIIVRVMFLGLGFQQFALAGLADRLNWVYTIFGVLFLAAAVVAFISPENTFAAMADILGFLFLLVGIFWIIEAFAAMEINPLWWLGLIAGILMVILGFYTGGAFFIDKAFVLLVFAGICSS